jgi:transposase InsO family protein
VRYAWIAAQRAERPAWPVEDLCRALAVTRSAYYAWRRRPRAPHAERDAALTALVHTVHAMSRRTYGSPRLHRELVATGTPCGRHRVARVMREEGLRGRQGRRFRPREGAPLSTLAPNRLARRFHAATTRAELDRHWVTDATAIPTRDGWLHLVAVLDVGSRTVVGWATADTLDHDVACRALRAALQTRRPAPGLLVHSDQGGPFTSRAFQQLVAAAGASASMSRRGNCWDNAVIESFFHTLKDERREGFPYPTLEAGHADLFEFIEVWYNRRRRHSTLNYHSPHAFERQLRNHEPS